MYVPLKIFILNRPLMLLTKQNCKADYPVGLCKDFTVQRIKNIFCYISVVKLFYFIFVARHLHACMSATVYGYCWYFDTVLLHTAYNKSQPLY